MLALSVGAAGAFAFHLAGLPAAFLSGAALAVAAAALAGLDVRLPEALRNASFVVLGTGMGTAVTPDAFAGVAEWPLAILALALTVGAVIASGFLILTRIGRFDRASAMCGAIPGALSHVIATAIEIGASLPKVALAQSLRLLLMVVVLPPLIAFMGGGAGLSPAALPAAAGPLEAALMIGMCGAFGLLLKRAGMPAALLLGSFVASGALHGFGLFDTRVPAYVLDPAFVVLGTAIGVAFAGKRTSDLLPAFAGGLAALLAALAISLSAAFLFARATGAPLGEIALAFAPGGIEAMITLAFVLGYDVPFVAALHLLRVFALILMLPLFLRLARRRAPGG